MTEFEHLKTAWKTWRKCPKLFEYLFIEHHPPSDAVEMLLGRTFHEFAQSFHEKVDSLKLMECTTAIDAMKVFEPLTVDQPIVKSWVENFKLFEVSRWLYFRRQFSKEEALKYWKPLAAELEIRFDELGRIHVDRIQLYDSMSLMNCEYKSGKTWDIRDLRSELTLYNIGINKYGTFKLPCLWIGAYNPQLNLSFVERVTQRSTSATWRSLMQFKDANNFSYKPSFFCRWCPRLQLCIDEKVFDMEVNNNARTSDKNK